MDLADFNQCNIIYGGELASTLCWKIGSQAVVETYFKNSKKALTAENNVVNMAKALVARMKNGLAAPRAAKSPSGNKVTAFALAA